MTILSVSRPSFCEIVRLSMLSLAPYRITCAPPRTPASRAIGSTFVDSVAHAGANKMGRAVIVTARRRVVWLSIVLSLIRETSEGLFSGAPVRAIWSSVGELLIVRRNAAVSSALYGGPCACKGDVTGV